MTRWSGAGSKPIGGREIKRTGDGIMASFATWRTRCAPPPTSSGASPPTTPTPSETLSVRIGIDAGEPVEDHNDLFGATVQLAARLCSEAEANGITVSGFARELCLRRTRRGSWRSASGDSKGFADKAQVFRFEWRD